MKQHSILTQTFFSLFTLLLLVPGNLSAIGKEKPKYVIEELPSEPSKEVNNEELDYPIVTDQDYPFFEWDELDTKD